MTVLRRDLSLVTTLALPEWSTGPGADDDPIVAAASAGYSGVQVFLPEQADAAAALGLAASAISPARTIGDVDAIAAMWAGGRAESVTLHLGTGFESDVEADQLVEAVFAAQDRHAVRFLIETHRATLTQDPARTLRLVDRYPELRFTADLSHWYTGVEMVYGDFDAKVAALAPVFARTEMVHGRVSDPGCIQVPLDESCSGADQPSYVGHFRQMWRGVVDACQIEELPFVVELLPARAFYARTVERDGRREEECDRWEQAEVLWRLAVGVTTAAAAGVAS